MTVDELEKWTKSRYYPTELCTSFDKTSSEITVSFRDCDAIPNDFFGANSTDYRAFFHEGNKQLVNNIKDVIFNPPATIVIWKDGSKTVVKCKDGDIFEPWTGFAMCICKRIFGDEFHSIFRKYCDGFTQR